MVSLSLALVTLGIDHLGRVDVKMGILVEVDLDVKVDERKCYEFTVWHAHLRGVCMKSVGVHKFSVVL